MTGVQPKTRELLATDVRGDACHEQQLVEEVTHDAERDQADPVMPLEALDDRAQPVALLDDGGEQHRAQRHPQAVEAELGHLAKRRLDQAEVAAPDEGHEEQGGVEAGERKAHQ